MPVSFHLFRLATEVVQLPISGNSSLGKVVAGGEMAIAASAALQQGFLVLLSPASIKANAALLYPRFLYFLTLA